MPTIGLGATVAIDDGASSAYQVIPDVMHMTVPDPECGVAESKRLNLSGYTMGKVATLLDPGQFTVTYEFSNTTKTRLDALVRVQHNFKVILPDSAWTRIAPGFIVSNKMDQVEADGIMTATVVIQVNGVVS